MSNYMLKKIYARIFSLLPATRLFWLKAYLLRLSGYIVGERVRCVSSAKFFLSGNLAIGSDTWIGHDVLVVGGNAAVTIGANCDVAPRVVFVTGTHKVSPLGPHVAGESYSLPIFVGNGTWVCTGAIILGGTTIGERSIVAAGAVVKGNFPSGVLIGGIPARIIKDQLF